MDFTLEKYRQLLQAFIAKGYEPISFESYFEKPLPVSFVILRHDVDRRIDAALRMAEMEAAMGLKATYNFRYRQFRDEAGKILEIHKAGHYCGYHYEALATEKGDLEKARHKFVRQLSEIRGIVPVETIAMHGSPLSSHDNRLLCKGFDYKSLALKGEAYLDVDFSEVFYLTDTGRLWNDRTYNLRDHVEKGFQKSWGHTNELLSDLMTDTFPEKVMLNVHPSRWNPPGLIWVYENYGQRARNIVKYILRPILLR